jgi:RNA polymerase sigma-70 factor (ECF subfamily)
MSDSQERDAPPATVQCFATTHWSVVLAAREPDAPRAAAALDKLCRTYWPPLYAYIRREGYGMEDAQDLTQEFLSRLVHKEWLNHLHDQRGKFRSFLLTFLKHFLSHERDRANALKRGGGQIWISLDACEAEERDALGPVDGLSADQIFDRRWARAVMDEAAGRLREEYVKRGKAELFEQLKNLQPGEHANRSYSEIGAALGLTEQAMKNAVHSFRRRYGELLRDEIAQTVDAPGEVEAEVRDLMQIFAR